MAKAKEKTPTPTTPDTAPEATLSPMAGPTLHDPLALRFARIRWAHIQATDMTLTASLLNQGHDALLQHLVETARFAAERYRYNIRRGETPNNAEAAVRSEILCPDLGEGPQHLPKSLVKTVEAQIKDFEASPEGRPYRAEDRPSP